jgi:hypothetical protein
MIQYSMTAEARIICLPNPGFEKPKKGSRQKGRLPLQR